MALKIAIQPITPPVHKPLITLEPTQEEVLVNEYIELNQKYEDLEMKKTTDRMTAIKKELQPIANANFKEGEKAFLKGELGELEFAACSEDLIITNKLVLLEHLVEKFGPEAAMSCVKFGLTELRKLLSPKELEVFSKKEPGTRTLKAVKRKSNV